VEQVNEWIRETVRERESLAAALVGLPVVRHVYPSDANFLLVQTTDPHGIYEFLVNKGIIVRDRSRVMLCEGCLRITVGTPPENRALIEAMHSFQG
jgi:histidinol-phosphate aminotransferase